MREYSSAAPCGRGRESVVEIAVFVVAVVGVVAEVVRQLATAVGADVLRPRHAGVFTRYTRLHKKRYVFI